ncbi:digestive cysteine proteinase 2-like isoform X1 [Hemiscyllium ocellatum]|uniref:digestive cysteine proteinase 2-like isoform X1 n=2 Tax=Hemiscyllium ocellatum TaxID=170820 RepID=UPI00296752D7|nr:digestive cysteine proteinase 2-like isoform X1 [Hemiscyllium ocellatum]
MTPAGHWMGIIFLFTLFSAFDAQSWMNTPKFPDTYHVTGILSLPFAEIKEPFEAWYNLSGNVSRIEYYHGQVITLQHGFEKPAGISYKISPETTETEINVIKCFQINGTVDDPIFPQSVFPNLKGFKFIKEEDYKGQHCSVWQNIIYKNEKKNNYTIWITNSTNGPIPVHYEMKGYNTLFGSHYDEYELDYGTVHFDMDSNIFELLEGLPCEGFTGPEVEHRILANPIQDLVTTDKEEQAHRLFQHYKETFNRDYETDDEEHDLRRTTFTHNVRYIHSMNRANLTYKLEVNHLADRTVAETAAMRGRLKRTLQDIGQPFPTDQYISIVVPLSVDWRLYGAVTPVKDQAVCGSCWSFAATGAIEGALYLKTGNLVPLSQQMLMDCTWGFGNRGCDGGLEWQTFEWIMKHGGIADAESYGSYMGQNGFCHYNQSTLIAKLKSYTGVTSGDTAALKMAIFKNGPVAVGIDVEPKSFLFYSSGVYYEPNCGNDLKDLNHAVLAVGFGTLAGQPYWLIKNSWSTYWGNDGYILMSMKDNNCGVATDAFYVTLE